MALLSRNSANSDLNSKPKRNVIPNFSPHLFPLKATAMDALYDIQVMLAMMKSVNSQQWEVGGRWQTINDNPMNKRTNSTPTVTRTTRFCRWWLMLILHYPWKIWA